MDNTESNNAAPSLDNNKISTLFKTIAYAGDKFMIGFRSLLPVVKASNIVILGMKEAGKTTLWHGLGGIETVNPNTRVQDIPSFIFHLENGRRVKVVMENKDKGKLNRRSRVKKEKAGLDIGGEDSYVQLYDKVIVPDSFVYYIADATRILEYKYWRRMRSDFRKIDSVVNKIGANKFGFKILLSHYDEWASNHPDSNPFELFDSFFSKVADVKPDGPVRIHLRERDESVLMAINLLENSEINKIKEEISKV